MRYFLWVFLSTCLVYIGCGPASARFGFSFEYETSELGLFRRTPCREQHATLPTASKNESLPNCVWMPEYHASVIPTQNAAKHNWNWQLRGISERKTHLNGIPWHFYSLFSFLLSRDIISKCVLLLPEWDKLYPSSEGLAATFYCMWSIVLLLQKSGHAKIK